MFRASEWLQSVSDAVMWRRNDAVYMDALRASTLSLGSQWHDVIVSSSGSHDRMAASDALVDHEAHELRGAWASATIREAVEVFEGMRSVGPLEQEAANVLQLVHLGLRDHESVARMLGMSRSTERRRYNYGVDWLDGNGLAHAKSGTGASGAS